MSLPAALAGQTVCVRVCERPWRLVHVGVYFSTVPLAQRSPWPLPGLAQRLQMFSQAGLVRDLCWAGKDPFGTSAVYPLPVMITFVSI